MTKKRVLTVTRAFGFHMMIKSISIKFRQLDSVVVTVAPLGLIGWGSNPELEFT